MGKNRRKGQSILEYTLLLGAIIAVLVVVLLGTSKSGGIKGQVSKTYETVGNALDKTTADLTTGVFQ
ncbi:MAG: hypothetical protein M0Q96_00695 [Candidatus Omnitrophica bacterium]|jgi:Flp pilus assembly pilin Flp|nr:hypothetical protein [Candidatus Omnitrophota bacterium]